MKSPKVSVVVVGFNESRFIEKSVMAILAQSYKDFELIIVDDHSNDGTFSTIINIDDKRIKIIRNEKNCGPVESRNRGIDESKGDIIFFTDGDCYPAKNWIEQGLASFKDKSAIGVEGTILMNYSYNSIREKFVENTDGRQYMTGNIAYRKNVLIKIGKFSDEFRHYYEDREIALRAMKLGKIIFNKEMVVLHQLKKWTAKGFILNARRAEGLVILYKKYGTKDYIKYRIVKPNELILIFFPPAIFFPMLKGRVSSITDFFFLPIIYVRAFYMRLIIWKTAIKQGVFLI